VGGQDGKPMICKECCNDLTVLSDDDGAVEFCVFCLDTEMAMTGTIAGKFRVRAIGAQEDDSLAGEVEELTILKEIEAVALLPWPVDGHYTFADGSKLEWYGWALKLGDVGVGIKQPLLE
jgi:hypothetical protein